MIDFGEAVEGFSEADISISNGTVVFLTDIGNGRFAASIDADSDGILEIGVPSGVAADAAGNPNEPASGFTVVVDTTAPIPLISGPGGVTNADHFSLTITFSEPVVDFTATGIDVSNGSVVELIDTGEATFAALIAATSPGPVTVTILSDAAADDAGNGNATGEQFSTTVVQLDFGDAPLAADTGFDSDYPVTLVQDGARHIVGDLFLGSAVDAEIDGQPDRLAGGGTQGGDDHDGISDESGVEFLTTLVRTSTHASTAAVSVVSSGPGLLDGWIDFNQDGDWQDEGEQVAANADIQEGRNLLSFLVPTGSSPGTAGARFRISSRGDLTPVGLAIDGEVEDYVIPIVDGDPDFGADVVAKSLSGLPILVSGGNLVVRVGQIETFSVASGSVGSLTLDGNSSDTNATIDLDNGFEFPQRGIRFEQFGRDSTLRIVGDGSVDSANVLNATGFASIDLSGRGAVQFIADTTNVGMLSSEDGDLKLIVDATDSIHLDDADKWRLSEPKVVDGSFWLVAVDESITNGESISISTPLAWRNFVRPEDVNNDGEALASDALAVVNELGARRFSDSASQLLTEPGEVPDWPGIYFDTSGDGRVSAIDALFVINRIVADRADGELVRAVPSVRTSVTADESDSTPPAMQGVRSDIAQRPGRWHIPGDDSTKRHVAENKRERRMILAPENVDHLLSDELTAVSFGVPVGHGAGRVDA